MDVNSALITVAQIAFLRPIREGAPKLPHVMTQVLANGYGRILAVFDSGHQLGATMPVGVMDFEVVCTTATEMRQHLLRYLSDTNYFVGFHLGWTLTALSLSLPASRVVDIGTEDFYQKLCIAMASRLPRWNQLINEQLFNSLDRRIPAVLFHDGIDLSERILMISILKPTPRQLSGISWNLESLSTDCVWLFTV